MRCLAFQKAKAHQVGSTDELFEGLRKWLNSTELLSGLKDGTNKKPLAALVNKLQANS